MADARFFNARRTSAVIIGLIVCAALFDIAHRYLGRLYGFGPVQSANTYFAVLVFWLTYLPLLPVPLFVARTCRVDVERRSLSLLAHVAGGALFSYVQILLASALTVTVSAYPGTSFGERFVAHAVWSTINNFPIPFLSYWAVVISMYGFYYQGESRSRWAASAQLQANLTETRLRALEAQLSPHVFFNTLNAISALAVKGNLNAVVEVLARLGDFLRACLDDAKPQQVPLAREIELADSYLEIQKLWFGDSLVVRRTIAPAAADALVPCMILQPLIENAILHGGTQTTLRRIDIEASPKNGVLRLEVRDNGPGFPTDRMEREGLGLSITRARLEQLYGPDYALEYGAVPGQGASVTIRIPLIQSRRQDRPQERCV